MRLFSFFLTIVLLSAFIITTVNAKDTLNSESTNYVEVVVSKGDTLWNIARPYHDGKSDFRNYVDRIIEVNHLKQAIIYPGQKLKIPVASNI